MLGEKERRALRPDAQACDEIRIFTVPRYKMSGLSGDEWRISATIQFYRKGKLIKESSYSNMEYAVRLLDKDFIDLSCGGGAYYAGEGNLCDQEGCDSEATVKYRLKKEFCNSGHGTDCDRPVVRLFCDEHKTRGDCGLEDADANYERV